MTYKGNNERRKYPRISGKFVVSYRVKTDQNDIHVSQTRNLSLGGMILTTNKNFPPGTILEIDIRLPFFIDKINLTGKVLEIKEIVKDLIYDARIQFLSVDAKFEAIIKDTVSYYLKVKK